MGSPAHTRAWIETGSSFSCRVSQIVARSHAGVDRNCGCCGPGAKGLKVARSHAGVDRNWVGLYTRNDSSRRPLTRGRGSKHIGDQFAAQKDGRPLTRGRGSKLFERVAFVEILFVARSHAGVDRNPRDDVGSPVQRGRPLTRGRGSKPLRSVRRRGDTSGRPLTRGRGSKPSPWRSRRLPLSVARSHAGVDRNSAKARQIMREARRPLTRGRGSKLG